METNNRIKRLKNISHSLKMIMSRLNRKISIIFVKISSTKSIRRLNLLNECVALKNKLLNFNIFAIFNFLFLLFLA
jgi:hypothetical protein